MYKSIGYFSVYLFFLIFSSGVVIVKGRRDDCKQPAVPKFEENDYLSEYQIKFPFRLRNFQAEECGYPGFDLSFTIDNRTVLHLPSYPHKLYVQDVNYPDQQIVVKLSESFFRSRESRRSLELLNLSTSPFRFSFKFSRFVRMNCSGGAKVQYVPSTGDVRELEDIRDVSSSSLVEGNSHFSHCAKMYSFNAPADPDLINNYVKYFRLNWFIPSCESCTQRFKGCRRKNNAAQIETECFDLIQREGPIKAIITAVSTLGSFLVLGVAVTMLYVYSRDKKEEEHRRRIEKFLEDYTALKPSRYSYTDIKKITDHFKIKLGEGAFGTVFKGKLSSDVLVAVKILTIPCNTAGDGEDFVNEVATMGRIHHINVVRLVGFCADGFRRALVYEFLPNHSLDKYISQNQSSLTWVQFNGIALGIAKGIDYLHQGCDQRILHFDIKPHNVLLDQNFTPKICDFGLAKLCSKDQSLVSMTATRGTMGYIAPEVFSRNFGKVSYKSDVYSFGMLLLEVVAGRKNTSSPEEEDRAEEIYYPEWIYNLLEEGQDLRIQVEEEADGEIAKRLAIVGLWCIQWHPAGRPTMKHAIQMLEGKGGDLKMPPNPFASMSGPSNTTPKIPAMQRMAFELEAIDE